MPELNRRSVLAAFAADAAGCSERLAAPPTAHWAGLQAGPRWVGVNLRELENGGRMAVWRPVIRPAARLTFGKFASQLCDQPDLRACLPDLDAAASGLVGGFDRALDQSLLATEGGAPAGPRFPLVIALGPVNASGAEFVATAEALASHGFVVASPSLPRAAAAPNYDSAQVARVRDSASSAISALESDTDVDTRRIGVIAWSFGGAPALLLAMHDQRIASFVSLDSAVRYAYGAALVRAAVDYDPLSFAGLVLNVRPGFENAVPKDESVFDAMARANVTHYLAEGFRHADFSDLRGALPALSLSELDAAARRARAAATFEAILAAFSEL